MSLCVIVVENLLFWIHGWLEKQKCNIITRERGIYSHLNMEDITDADYAYTKRISKDF